MTQWFNATHKQVIDDTAVHTWHFCIMHHCFMQHHTEPIGHQDTLLDPRKCIMVKLGFRTRGLHYKDKGLKEYSFNDWCVEGNPPFLLTSTISDGECFSICRNMQHLPSHRHHALTHAQRWKLQSAPPSKHVCNLLVNMRKALVQKS